MTTVNEEVKCNCESELEDEVVKDYCPCWKCLDAYDGINETSCTLRDPTPIPPCLWMKDHIAPQSTANRMVYDAKEYAFGFFIAQERLHVGEIETSILCVSANGAELVLSRRSDDCLPTREVVDEMMKSAKREYEAILLDVKKRYKSKKEKESAGGKSKKEKTRATSPY